MLTLLSVFTLSVSLKRYPGNSLRLQDFIQEPLKINVPLRFLSLLIQHGRKTIEMETLWLDLQRDSASIILLVSI